MRILWYNTTESASEAQKRFDGDRENSIISGYVQSDIDGGSNIPHR